MVYGLSDYWTNWLLDEMVSGRNGNNTLTLWIVDELMVDQMIVDELVIGRIGIRPIENKPMLQPL